MKIKSIQEFNFPIKLETILKEEEYWEDESFEPITITVEEIQFNGKNIISYQADFEVLDEFEEIEGDEWEELIIKYIERNDPELLEFVNGDSESSTCVIWTSSQSNFKKILGRMIELIENKNEVAKIRKEESR